MGIKIIIALCLLGGLKLVYGAFIKANNIHETAIDATWWQGLSEEWRSILLINQNFQKQNVDIFKLQN